MHLLTKSLLSFPSGQCDTLSSGPDNSICAFLNFSTGCSEFATFETFSLNGVFTIAQTSTIPAPQFDLVDYQLVRNRIWALWCNSDGDFDVSTICLNAGSINWVSVALEMPPDQSDINANVHARQEYCSYIFSPGRFQAITIAKALVMFRRSNVPVDADLPMYKLKERVCQAIECEMQNEVKDLDVTDEEYIDINLQLWERFYSCCEQYHVKATQPIGLVSLEALGGMCVVKRNMFALIRPCELLEHVMLSSGESRNQSAAIVQFPRFQNRQTDENLAALIGVLGKVEAVLPSAVKMEIYNKLLEQQMPSNIVSDIVRQFLSLEVEEQPFSKDFIAEIRQKLLQISDVPQTMWQLLECLQMNEGRGMRRGSSEEGNGDADDESEPMDTYRDIGEKQRHLFELGNLFCSQLGKSFVAESMKQIIMIRYALCRNLLILQHLLSETFSLPNEVLKRIQSNCSADSSVCLQAYFVMKWICVSPISVAQIAANQKNDAMNQVLQTLQLYETFPRQSFSCVAASQYTLFEYFLHGKGSIMALTQLAEDKARASGSNDQDEDEVATLEVMRETGDWDYTLNEMIKRVGRLIYPMAPDFVFGEWLIGTGQCIMIEEYVRLMNGWCQWNRCSRDFILAVTQLNNGELYKAYDNFMSATSGVDQEKFLHEKVLGGFQCTQDGDGMEVRQAVVAQYYMKVLQMFEQKPALDCVIRMAKAAIEILSEVEMDSSTCSPSVPRKAMFQSIVFMNQLKLEHYEEAYDSLINNVEEQRRKEGLRQLVVCLFQKKRLDLLMHFPYVGLQAEFEHIVEQRARSMGVEENVHYKFLYAHHVTKENMRKAAFCMYEQAMRLQLECDTVAAMEARYESLLICINALHLVDEKYQFIAKPVVTREQIKPTDKLQVEVLEIGDVKRELVHTEALLALQRVRTRNETVGGSVMRLDAQELIGVLSSAHLFTMALRLADAFRLSKTPVIKSLTCTCIDLSSEDAMGRSEAWNWLQENNVTDLPASNSAVDTAWHLLQRLIGENEKELEGGVELRRAAIEAILSSTTAFVPRWLLDSMRRANANVLLHLFVKYGRLVEASEFAVELVWAMLGRGAEYFGLHNPLMANGAPLCFPVNAMDLLIYNLRVNVEENADKLVPGDLEQLKECLKGVRDVCEYYHEKALEVSQYKAKYERQIANRMEV